MSFLPILIWHGVILEYLLRLQHKSRQTWLLIAWFSALTLLMGSQCFSYAVYAPIGGYVQWIGGILTALSAVGLEIQFAYTFPHPLYPCEMRLARKVSLGIVLGIAGLILFEVICLPAQSNYNFGQSSYGPKWVPTGHIFPSAMLFNPLHITGHVWAMGVWLRKMMYLETGTYRLRDFVRCLLHPQNREARTARDFALLIAAAALASAVQILEAEGLLPSGVFAGCYALVLFGIMLTYLSNTTESSSFMLKLVSISLVALLVLLGLVNPRILQTQQAVYEQARQSDLAHLAPLLADAAGGLPPGSVPPLVQYIAAHPAAEGLLAEDYTLFFTRTDTVSPGVLAAQDAQLVQGAVQRRRDVQLVIVDEFPWLTREQVVMEIGQLERLPLRWSTLTYRGSYAAPSAHYLRYLLPAADGKMVYEVGYNYPVYRQMLHRAALPLVTLLIGTTALILFVFPRFFQASLVKPLETLLSGVARVNQGDLEVVVPIHQEDEIGFLARSFNAMVCSRRRADAEVRESEARFRALFEHAPLCIFEVDLAARPPVIVRVNEQVMRVYGQPEAALIGADLTYIAPALTGEDIRQLVEARKSGQSVPLEVAGRRSDGTLFPIRVSAATAAMEMSVEAERVVLNVEDITAEKARRSEEEAIAEERRRIAREIHDGVAQDLAALRVRVGLWHDLVDSDPAQMHAELDTLQDLLRANIQEVRRSIFALRPVALEELGFYPALHQFVGDVGEQNQLRINLEVVGPPERLPAALEPVVFRIIQEALNNIAKHARASAVWIMLNLESVHALTLAVRDNGHGFDVQGLAQAVHHGHVGLVQMRERVEKRHGTFALHSLPGRGTEIKVEIPF